MNIQAGTHAIPFDLISVIGKLTGKRQHGVGLRSCGLSGHRNGQSGTGAT